MRFLHRNIGTKLHFFFSERAVNKKPLNSFSIVLFIKNKRYKVWGFGVYFSFECMLEGRTTNGGDGGGGVWGVSGPCKAPGATAALNKDKARASSGFTATTKSKLSLLISFQSLRDATFTSEEAVCCCHHRRCCCSKVSPQCRVDLRKEDRKKQKTKEPVADPGADRLFETGQLRHRVQTLRQLSARLARYKNQAHGEGKLPQQPWNSASTSFPRAPNKKRKKESKGRVCQCVRTEGLVFADDYKVNFVTGKQAPGC